MMLQNDSPYISEIGKSQGELAASRDKDVDSGKDTKAFWYWLGYYTGQDSILNKDQKTKTQESQS